MTYLFSSNTLVTGNVNIFNSNGHSIDTGSRLPVDIGNTSINISGNVNVNFPQVITVNSTPSNPVHVHLTEVGNYGLIDQFVPISGNVVVTGVVNTNVLVINTANVYNLGGYINVSNFPVTQNVVVTSIPSVNIGNLPTIQNVNVDNTANTYSLGGTINVSNFPVNQNVTITSIPVVNVGNLPLTQNVAVINISNSAIINTANVYNLGGYVNVSNFPVSQNVIVTNLANTYILGTANVYLSEGHANVTVVANNASPVLVKYADSTQLDTLSRLRTGQIQSQFWYAPLVDSDGDWRYSFGISGNNANIIFIANTSETQLNSGTSSGGYVIKQSRVRYKIVPGASHQAFFTVNWSSNSTTSNTVTKRVGLFDGNNGIFWENTDNSLAVVVRRMLANGYVTEDRTYSNTFNTDKLDGTGSSGFDIFTAGLDKYYTLWFDFTGGRTGRVRFGMGTTAGATIVHTQNYTGSIATNFITDNSLPVRKEIVNQAAQTTNAYFSATGSVFQYEEPRSFNPFLAAGQHIAGFTPDGTMRPIMTVGLRNAWPYNKADITLQDFQMIDTNNQTGKNNAYDAIFLYQLIYNANVNSTYAWAANGAISNTNIGKASNYITWPSSSTFQGGKVLKSGVFTSGVGEQISSATPETFNFGSDVSGYPDTITIAVQLLAAGYATSNVVCTMGWLEQL